MSSLRHEALPYEHREAFVQSASEFLIDAVTAGEPALCLAERPRITAVREQMAAAASGVTWVDTELVGGNPAHLLPLLRNFIRTNDGRPVRALGDLAGGPVVSPQLDEVHLHELLLSAAECRSWPLWLLCSYHVPSIGARAAALLDRVHARTAAGTDRWEDAEDLFAAPLPEPPSTAERLAADVASLTAMRSFVHERAVATGVEESRAEDLVYAVNEAVTNSICHGAGQAVLSVWSEPEWFCCDVHDRGRITDPMVGRATPGPGQPGGRGLWLVHHLCDLAQVRSSTAGTTVRMRVAR